MKREGNGILLRLYEFSYAFRVVPSSFLDTRGIYNTRPIRFARWQYRVPFHLNEIPTAKQYRFITSARKS